MIYYNGDKRRSMRCDYDVLFGGRANGKSYDVCKNDIIDDYFNSGCTHEFGLVRRVGYGASASVESLTKWFADDLHKYLKEKYNSYIKVESNTFYIVNYDDETEELKANQKKPRLKAKVFGHFFSLAIEEKYKSQQFDNVHTLVYEEFCPMSIYGYIEDEITHFTSLISTIFRHRNGKIILIGNTINKYNIYFDWLGIDIDKLELKPGDIIKLQSKQFKDGATICVDFAKMPYEDESEIPHMLKIGKCEVATTGDYTKSEYCFNSAYDGFIFKECKPTVLFAIEIENTFYYVFRCTYKNYNFIAITNRCQQQKVKSNIYHYGKKIIEAIKLGHKSFDDIYKTFSEDMMLPTIFSDEYIEYRYRLLMEKYR